MTITNARKKFEVLKTQILKDDIVDLAETYVLLEFIEEYAKSGKKDFVDFEKSLRKYAEDGVITKEESDLIVKKIDSISAFLKVEQIIEWIFFSVILVSLITYIFYIALH